MNNVYKKKERLRPVSKIPGRRMPINGCYSIKVEGILEISEPRATPLLPFIKRNPGSNEAEIGSRVLAGRSGSGLGPLPSHPK